MATLKIPGRRMPGAFGDREEVGVSLKNIDLVLLKGFARIC